MNSGWRKERQLNADLWAMVGALRSSCLRGSDSDQFVLRDYRGAPQGNTSGLHSRLCGAGRRVLSNFQGSVKIKVAPYPHGERAVAAPTGTSALAFR